MRRNDKICTVTGAAQHTGGGPLASPCAIARDSTGNVRRAVTEVSGALPV
jgi:hypothetical protein